MADPLAGAMGPLMDTLAARAIERAVDAGEIDPDLYYERWRDRQIEDMVQADADTRAGEMLHSKDEPDDEDEEPPRVVDAEGRELDPEPDYTDYLAALADMGIEPHEYEAHS